MINYDPNKFDFIGATDTTRFTPGRIYSDYPVISTVTGKVKVSGTSSLTTGGYNGIGLFGIIHLKAKSTESTDIAVDFSDQKSSSSTVIDVNSTKNILKKADKLSIKLRS